MTIHDALAGSAEELALRLKAHQELLHHVSQGAHAHVDLATCPTVRCPHQRLLRQTLAEVIAVLDDTRRSFKSKQLETLRKRLIDLLATTE